MSWIVIGFIALLLGVAQLLLASRIHDYYRVGNEGRSRWWQNPRGWSLGMVRYLGILAVLSGAFLILFGMSQRSG